MARDGFEAEAVGGTNPNLRPNLVKGQRMVLAEGCLLKLFGPCNDIHL